MKEKEFDAVRMMREIRDELSGGYNEDPSGGWASGVIEALYTTTI